jgi:chemotaxis methyl-accepting protein methylase
MDNHTTQNVGVNTSVLLVCKRQAVPELYMLMRTHLHQQSSLHSKWQHLRQQVTLTKTMFLRQPHQWPSLQPQVKMPRTSWP